MLNWALTVLVVYITVAVMVSRKKEAGEGVLLIPLTIILTIPALRAMFVGSPPFGILLDVVGLFVQMIVVGLCSIALLLKVGLVSKTEDDEEGDLALGLKKNESTEST